MIAGGGNFRSTETEGADETPETWQAPAGLAPELWRRLRDHARSRSAGAEPAHDFFHVERVVGNALTIVRAEGGNEAIASVAALLHELFTLPKSHPESWRAGDLCAEHARALLVDEHAPSELVEPVCAAIRDHAFSKGVVPDALESCILQDADRLDALGAIGLARMWATCADMKRPFYSPEDPFATRRVPDDKSWGLDHVYKKLLLVPERLHLPTSRAIAAERTAFIRSFVEQLQSEIAPAPRRGTTLAPASGTSPSRTSAVTREPSAARELALLRAQVAYVDRLTAIGAIAVGVVHEINNPLGFMRLSTEVFERELGQLDVSPKLLELVSDMYGGIDRITRVVRELRAFIRHEDDVDGVADPGAAIDAAVRLVSYELAARVKLRREYDARALPLVVGTRASLEQVFVQVLLHAALAFSEKTRAPGELVLRATASDSSLTIDVVDEASVRDPSLLADLFQPRGHGAPRSSPPPSGLSTCRDIVRRLGGSLDATSASGVGTVLRVVLPRAPVPGSDTLQRR